MFIQLFCIYFSVGINMPPIEFFTVSESSIDELKKGVSQHYQQISSNRFHKDLTFNKIRITFYNDETTETLFTVEFNVDKTTLKANGKSIGSYKPSTSSSSSTSSSTNSASVKSSSSDLKMTTNGDGSVTYNGYGTVGSITAYYYDWTIYPDGHTTGSYKLEQ
ncbi:MAG: hypothetical protein CfClM3_1634 [Methanobrevibacter sp. CfCl-M3]